MNYKNFGQFLFEASDAAEDRKKSKDMTDKLKKAKETEAKAKETLDKVESKDDVKRDELIKAKLIHKKAEAGTDSISADIQLKNLEKKDKKD
jgi:hypothetical protein